jgi:hypothetical protein
MIAETMAGIALVKSAVEGIKSAIGTANDIGEIASYIDNLFEGEKQIQQKRSKKQNNILSIGSVAKEAIDAKLAQEQMYEISQLIDLRFGHGTWQGIVNERAKRLQEIRELEEAARKKAIRKNKERIEIMIWSGAILGGLSLISFFIYFAIKGA